MHMPKKSKLKNSRKPTSVILPEALLVEIGDVLKSTDDQLAKKLQEAIAMFKRNGPHGYVWSDEFDGGCFVYAHECPPEHAYPVYVLN